MRILNLARPEQSEIKYKISKFPDGQQQVNILDRPQIFDITDEQKWLVGLPIQIKARLNNFRDLELIACTVASLRNLGIKEIHLYCPYFEGSRSDRQFEEGGNNYLKQVICPIINSLNFESVTVLDPHSHVLEACLNNFKSINNSDLVCSALEHFFGDNWNNNTVMISPDAGATHKIYKLAEQIGYKGNIITCTKERDNEGNLTKCVVPYKLDYFHPDKIVIDDICDGGATFINIAKTLKSGPYETSKGKLYLVVTHGIFSKGFEELSQYFDGIYCTNSYSNITFPWNMKGYLGRNSNQLNVF